jgi:hypothetical protein
MEPPDNGTLASGLESEKLNSNVKNRKVDVLRTCRGDSTSSFNTKGTDPWAN